MEFLINQFGVFNSWLIASLFIFLRYVVFAGLTFLFFYKLKKHKYQLYKIQLKFPKPTKISHEWQQSLATAFIFALAGVLIYYLQQAGKTAMYFEITTYGWGYFVASFFILLILHDTYFYWMHRLMHHPFLFPIFHRVHHLSHNPTPWTAMSFHPLEAVVEIAIIPLVVLLIPFHPLVLVAFGLLALIVNIIGHLGYELLPNWFLQHPVFKWFNTSTHHNMHHSKVRCNYGLYFNFWDTFMGTNHKDYEATFEEITGR